MLYQLQGKRVWVAGHRGMVGSAIVKALRRRGIEPLIIERGRLDLRRQEDVEHWLADHRPHAVIVAAAKVGGILANHEYPADFLYDNLAIEMNVIMGAFKASVEKLLFLGSTCIYPKMATQPIRESELLTGPLEPTNQWYAVAKIAGLKLCEALRVQHGSKFISAMPTNLYGKNDNFDLQSGHVLPALMRRIHEAKVTGARSVSIWGSGQPRREFLYVEDLADACVFLMENYCEASHINVGTGSDITISELAEALAAVIGYDGHFEYDLSRPDGTPRKLTDTTLINKLGWRATTSLEEGLGETYQWFLANDPCAMTQTA